MKYKELAYYDGKISNLRDMSVPMLDRACYFGDGIYDACEGVGGKLLGIDDHMDRCYNGMAYVGIEPPMEKAEMKALIIDLASQMEAPVNFVYWQITRGVGMRNHIFAGAETGSKLWIMINPKPFSPIDNVCKLITAEDKRYYFCCVKSLNLLPNVLYNQRATEAGADETVLHRNGRVTECAHSNVSILKDGVFRTAPLDELILPGVTRKHLIAICKEQGIPVAEEPYTLDDLRNADEIIISSASNLCCSTSHLDGVAVGGKDPVTLRRIREGYAKRVHDECGYDLTWNNK